MLQCTIDSLHTLFQHTIAMSSFPGAVEFDLEKFDGRINFGLWQIQVKDVLIQSRLQVAFLLDASNVSLVMGEDDFSKR